jgi:hypothetical protein
VEEWYRTQSPTYKTSLACKQIIPYCTYNRLPEDESSDSKHVEDIAKLKILV